MMAPGVYMLSVNDPGGAARPNSGRLELQQDMSLQGVVGDHGAVTIDANNLPVSSYNNVPPIPLTAAIRMGRGTNSIEWLTVENAIGAAANIETDLNSTGTVYIRIEPYRIPHDRPHAASMSAIFGAAGAGRVIKAKIVDNDTISQSRWASLAKVCVFVNNLGADSGVIIARY